MKLLIEEIILTLLGKIKELVKTLPREIKTKRKELNRINLN